MLGMIHLNDEKEEKKETEKRETSKEEQMKGVAEVYGISLADIEEVHLPNGKEYFKFYNPKDRTVKMIENRKDGKNLSEQFKEIQKTLASSQGDDSLANARAVFDYQLKFENVELNLIPIHDLKGNSASYRYLLDSLDMGKKKAVRVLLENIEYLNLEYINLENAIGIDKDRRVINSEYNYQTGKCELKAAEIRNYETNQATSTGDTYTFDVTEEEFDSLVANIDVSSDIPTIIPEEEVEGKQSTAPTAPTIRGRSINMAFAIQAFMYPEIIERSEMSDFDKMLYQGIARALHRKREKKAGLTDSKQYVLKKDDKNSQAAFVDGIFLVLVSGFCAGMVVMFLMMI